MYIESSSVEGRAARHAALSDPARLRIVDALSVGDLSPTELGDRFGISSNLLAHHLKVMESAGILVRRRSEADRRRTYIHLRPGALAALYPTPSTAAHRIVFVCTGNSARSQLAAALWRESSGIPVASAGTHPAPAIEAGAIAVARRHGLSLAAQRPQSLDDVLAADDFIVTVCDAAREEMTNPTGSHWSVPDPVRVGNAAAFETAFDDLAQRINDLAPRLTAA